MTLFEKDDKEEVLTRLNGIAPDTKPQWGKMNAAQMMAHCQAPFQTFFGQIVLRRGLLGFFFGKAIKKKLFSNKPWAKNLPTAKEFKMSGAKEFAEEKQKLIGYIHLFADEGYTITSTVHPIFGNLSSQEWATFVYKHLDHHLRQFGV